MYKNEPLRKVIINWERLGQFGCFSCLYLSYGLKDDFKKRKM